MPKKVRRGEQDGASAKGEGSEARAKVEAYVMQQSPAHTKTINRLRTIIRSAVPELHEQMRWAQVGYLISKRDVCGVYATSDHVNLSFMQGATLRDPKGLLEGTGKGMRHVKIFRVEDVDEDTIKGYVKEAVASIQRPSR
jgi:hypothetical protein